MRSSVPSPSQGVWDLGPFPVLAYAMAILAARGAAGGRPSGRLGAGKVFVVYVALCTVGRAWTEYLRVDHANHVLGLRLNDWTSLIVFTTAVTFLVTSQRAWTAPSTEPLETEQPTSRAPAP